MWKNARLALVGDGARQPRLAGPGRSVEQHALGRIDAQALENLRVAQRQLDHLAQRVDGVLHSAEVVVGDVGAALAVLLGIFGKQLDLGLGVDVDDALGHRADDRQPHLLQREGRRAQHLAHFLGHVGVDPLVALGRDDVAFGQRTSGEAAPQRFGRSMQPQIVLCRGQHDPRRRLRLGLADLDKIARADAGIGALQAVEADDVDAFILAVRPERARRGRALADDLDDVAFLEAELLQQPLRQSGKAAAAFGRGHVGDLHARRRALKGVGVGHSCSLRPAFHAANVTAAAPLSSIGARARFSIFDRSGDLANQRPRNEPRRGSTDLVERGPE